MFAIPKGDYVSQDASTSSPVIYEDPGDVLNESGINQEDYMQPFSVTIPNEAYVSQDAHASSAISLAVYEDPETVANESGINLAEYLPPLSSNEAYISHDASSVIEETSGTNLSG